MNILSGMARTFGEQRANTTQNEQEEANLRALARMRAGDETANYNKRMDRAAQEAWARSAGDADSLPDGVDVPRIAGLGAPAPNDGAPPAAYKPAPIIQRSAGQTAPQPKPNQDNAESLRLARKLTPAEAGAQGERPGAKTPALVRATEASQARRFEELKGLNPVPEYNERNADTQRLQRGAPPDIGRTDADPRGSAPSGSVDFDQFANAIYGQESTHGKADTSQPNYATAQGPMQVTAKTFEGLKRNGQIPAHYDIANPQHNMEAGRALLKTDWERYGGDPRKTAAAYYSGPKAVQGDNIVDYRDPKNAKAPSTRQYVDQVMARVGQTAPAKPSTATTATAGPQPTAEPMPATIPREQFANFSNVSNSRERMQVMRNDRLREVLQYTRDPRQQQALVAQIELGNVDVYETRLVRTAAQGGAGDMRALSQLAQVMGVSLSSTSDGRVVIVAPNPDGNGTVKSVLTPAAAANQLYSLASPRVQAARAAAQQKVMEFEAQSGLKRVEAQEKGVQDRQTAMVTAEGRLQEELLKLQAKGAKIEELSKADMGRPALYAINGVPHVYQPPASIDGMQTEGRMVPVRTQ